jgi:hypothetical protein
VVFADVALVGAAPFPTKLRQQLNWALRLLRFSARGQIRFLSRLEPDQE